MGHVKRNHTFRAAAEAPIQSGSPRICMPTWRNFTKLTFRCGLYEAQDVLVEIDDVDLICLDLTWAAWFNEYWLRAPIYHDVSKKLIFANPGLRKVQLSRDYDVFIAVCTGFWDLPYINAIERWRDHCKVGICWLDELWISDIPGYKYWLHALNQFDYVFTGMRSTVSALSRVINRPCYWLPGGIDARRFSPLPGPATRGIDVYSIGRRYEGIHRELLKAAERGELFYIHDTHMKTSETEVYDHRQHRDLLANIAKRSRFFVVAPAKMNRFDQTRGQVEIGYRYYEGAAAGTVMIGETPDCEAYRELFQSPEAVIDIRPDGSDIMAVLGGLVSNPERMTAISRQNTKHALLHHDWVYRWSEMFRVAGVGASPRVAARERHLKDMADSLPTSNDLVATR
jgi:hypothetical protein